MLYVQTDVERQQQKQQQQQQQQQQNKKNSHNYKGFLFENKQKIAVDFYTPLQYVKIIRINK